MTEHEDDQIPLPQTSPTSSRPGSGGVRRWWLVVAIVLAYLAQVGWRLWLARSVPTPVAHVDEDRYLLAARALAGGPGGFGNDTVAFRRLGYPLLLSPIYWFASDPFKVYHAAQAIGAVVNALTFPLAYLFSRRVFGTGRRLALGAAFVVATLPSVAYYGEFALTDAIFAPIGLSWLLLLHAWLTAAHRWSRIAAAVGAGAVVGYAYAVHVRGTIMLAIHLGVLAILVVARRSRWTLPAISVGVALAATRVDWFAQRLVGDRLVHGGIEPNNQLLSRLTDARGMVHTICDAAGQVWYIGVGTWGLAAVGLVVAVQRVRGRDVQKADLAQRVVLATAVAATVLIALASAAALPPDGRVSNHAYPRYIAFLAPVWVLLAISALIRADRRRAWWLVGAASVVMATGAFLVLARWSELYGERFEAFDTPEVSFMAYTWNVLPVARATPTAALLVALFAFAVTARRRPRLVGAALAGVLVMDLATMAVVNAKSVGPMAAREYAHAPLLVHDLHVGPGDVVASSTRVGLGAGVNHEREVYWGPVAQFDDRVADPPADATVVIAPWNTDEYSHDPRHLGQKLPAAFDGDWDGEALGWRRLAGDPKNFWAVWLRTADPRLDAPISVGNGS